MNAELRESLYDLYEIGGLELLGQGSGGSRRELLLDLETSALTPMGYLYVFVGDMIGGWVFIYFLKLLIGTHVVILSQLK